MTVWIGVVASIVVVAVELNLLSRVRVKLNLVDQSRRENDADFDLRNSAWFSYASLLRKAHVVIISIYPTGVQPQPRSTPNRILAGAWGLFGLIVISTYTANLTAFLTVKRQEQSIRSMDDLVVQTKIEYGIPKGGSTHAFFHDQQTTGTVYGQMWNYMNTKETMVSKVPEGIKQVKKGEFVFMYDTPMLEYLTMTDENCELMMVGKPFRHLGYGLATKHRSKLSHKLSLVILKLKEAGKIDKFRNVWWPTVGCALDGRDIVRTDADQLGLDSFYGIFIIIGAGLVLPIIYVAIEVIWMHCCKRKTQMMGDACRSRAPGIPGDHDPFSAPGSPGDHDTFSVGIQGACGCGPLSCFCKSEAEFSLTKQEPSKETLNLERHENLLGKALLRAINSGMVQIFIQKAGGSTEI
ncbi:glutamate receptor ionotropic, delta-1-like [Branchiostoma lanceolatum]|uniref:glutamate receptor ionotropic, delta-1-like n=1 Tax=Branchiostoma lanceolatum TaxID=7740 RepID=UPI0034511E83